MNTLLPFRRASHIALALSALLVSVQCRATERWGPWPAGQDPKTVGTTLVQNLLARPKLDLAKSVGYQETCAGYGAVRFAADSGNADLLKQVIARYETITTPEGAKLNPKPVHVDSGVYGILPLEIYKNTKDPKYLALGLSYADAEFAKLNPEGLSALTRYYIDDAYKVAVMQILAYRATSRPVYAAQAVKELDAFIDKLQQPGGLFIHGPEARIAWGRGNGWIAAALAETLMVLPATDPSYAKIMTSYQSMMAALLKVQAPDGRWRQVVDDPKAFEENSCTGYFIFALAEGVDHGWLDAATYKAPVRKAWGALCGQIDAKGNVADVSVLTEHSNDEAYYLARPIAAGNLHGQFAALWSAAALLDTNP